MENKNNHLQVVNQKTQLLKTYKDGISTIDDIATLCRVTPIEFVKQSYLTKPIRTDLNPHNQKLLTLILVKTNTLAGFKGEIDDLTKQDIANLILNRFNSLSVMEIWKAFENERFGLYEYKTNAYNYFGADYVSEILKKYENWKLELKQKYNITKANSIPIGQQLPEISESKKKEIMDQAILRCWNEYLENKTISNPFKHVFEELVKRGFIKYPPNEKTPKLQAWYDEKRELAKELVQKELQAEKMANQESPLINKRINEVLSDVSENKSSKIDLKLFEIVLMGIFQKRIDNQLPIEDLLK